MGGLGRPAYGQGAGPCGRRNGHLDPVAVDHAGWAVDVGQGEGGKERE